MSTSSLTISSETSSPSLINSIYIPRVFSNIHPNVIGQTFERLNIGVVNHIQVIQRPKKKGKSSAYMAFVYFKEWFNNQSALNLAERVLDPEKQARVVYDDPYYWIILPNTTKTKGKGKSKSPQQVSSSVPSSPPPASSSSFNIEKMESLYLMIEDLQERVMHIEEYLSLLHKYNSLSQLPSSPVSHPDDDYEQYTKDSDAEDAYTTYSYSEGNDDDYDTEVSRDYSSSSHHDRPREGLSTYYCAPELLVPTPTNQKYSSNATTTVRVDPLGLVYYKENTTDDDSRFWCDP